MLKTALDDLVPLEAGDPPLPDSPAPEDLRPWRDRIDALDRAILYLLNERSRCANVIGHIKKKLGMPVYVPSREEEVLQNVFNANPGPLPAAAVRRIFERIIDETRALERQTYQDEPRHDTLR
ncbi:chorismate mutase [Rhodocaloribacter litoris]|uniref:chorismate mutase n=1 Tax=Rhodocaloribacter litoris TaxID=2558931 RepID=UPI001423FD15|nr:chorismate mutase [Rhodocaloribacter litoris]QXD16336.1 chorismate mutase [Rhodocaloribacter litoris]